MCRISGESRCIDVARFWPIGPLRSVSSASIMPLIFESGGSALARFGTAFASSPLESIFLPRHRHPQVRMRSETEIQSLRELLNHERNLALAKVREYRTAQEEDALPPPSDELDSARALADVETHASLIERNEERLQAIDFAFNMHARARRYGQRAQCGDRGRGRQLDAQRNAGHRNELSPKGPVPGAFGDV
jgi:RNA polymerase-binding transcription factor DksA